MSAPRDHSNEWRQTKDVPFELKAFRFDGPKRPDGRHICMEKRCDVLVDALEVLCGPHLKLAPKKVRDGIKIQAAKGREWAIAKALKEAEASLGV